jgi:hypothetical protein
MTTYQSQDARQVTVFSGVVAAGASADSEIATIRWTHATQKLNLLAVVISAAVGGTAFTAGAANFRLTKATSWTVDGTGGGTSTLTGTNAKLDTAITGQATPTIRVATTAALGAGTKTLDDTDIGGIRFTAPATVTHTQLITDVVLFSDAISGARPVVLNTNEGMVIRATVPATGTWGFSVTFVYTVG